MNRSAPQVAICWPSGENSAAKIVSLCGSLTSRTSLPSATFQSFNSPLRDGSPLPVASNLLSGLKASEVTRSINCWGASIDPIVRVNFHLGFVFQMMAELLAAMEITSPSALNSTKLMAAPWPLKDSTGTPLSPSHV